MAFELATIILGDEYDDNLKNALRTVLVKNGAISFGKAWGVGGSQEIETVEITIGADLIIIESETFIGLTITGPKATAETIAEQVRQQMSRL